MLLPSSVSFELENACFGMSPPTSPQPSSSQPSTTISSSIWHSCRALQSLLTPSNQLPPTPQASPPHLNAPVPQSAAKFRMRSARPRKMSDGNSSPTMRVSKRPMVTQHKKRGREEDVGGLQYGTNSRKAVDAPIDGKSQDLSDHSMLDIPSTPKRSRIAPEAIPFGLARGDYHDLHLKSMYTSSSINKRSPPAASTLSKQSKSILSSPPPPQPPPVFPFTFTARLPSRDSSSPTRSSSALVPSSSPPAPPSSIARSSSPSPFNNPQDVAMPGKLLPSTEAAAEKEWAIEDDKMLIELVLEKLNLSKSELEECARSLGRDSGSVSKRWKSLLAGGSIGLKQQKKGRNKRSKIPETWR